MQEARRVVVWCQELKDRPHLALQWHDPITGGRRSRTSGTADPDQADRRRADLEYELNHGLHQDASDMSWSRFRALFEDEYVASRRPATRRNFASALDLFEECCHPKRLRGVTERTLSAFAASLRKRVVRGGRTGMAASTMRVTLSFLRAALRWAVHQKLLPECPRFPLIKVPRTRPQPVPTESFERLYAKAGDDATRALLLCGWLAGLRRGEAYALEWSPTDRSPWVDFARGRVVFPAEFVKGAEDQWLPLDPWLREALELLPRRGRRVFDFRNRSGRPLGPSGLSHRVVRLARLAGVKLTLRALRRGFGCFYAARVPAQVLQKLMRHADIRITMDYYVNIDSAVEEAVLDRKRSARRANDPLGNVPEGAEETLNPEESAG
jgi:integrase